MSTRCIDTAGKSPEQSPPDGGLHKGTTGSLAPGRHTDKQPVARMMRLRQSCRCRTEEDKNRLSPRPVTVKPW